MKDEKQKVVWLKDLAQDLKRRIHSEVDNLEFMMQGGQWCSMEEFIDRDIKNIIEDPLKALRKDFVILPPDLYEAYDEMITGNAVEVSSNDRSFEWYSKRFYFDLQELEGSDGERYLCRMAEEIRAAISADRSRYERLLELRDELVLYINSATVLYGYVTYKEVCELYNRWNDDGLVDEWMVEFVAKDELEYKPVYFIHNGCICNKENDCGAETDRIVELFLAARANKPRWFPESENEFFDWCDETTHIETETAKALDAFLKEHGFQDINKRIKLMSEIVSLHQIGERIEKIVASVLDRCDVETDSDSEEYLTLIGNFLNNIRLRVNNGWTPAEVFANSSSKATTNATAAPSAPVVLKQPKVGRNSLCPCGSGKKYKKCCGR